MHFVVRATRDQMTVNGSQSVVLTIQSTPAWVSSSCITFLRNPRSVFEWLQTMTALPISLSLKTSWWDISPVKYRSTSSFKDLKTPEPLPAHNATLWTLYCAGEDFRASCTFSISSDFLTSRMMLNNEISLVNLTTRP